MHIKTIHIKNFVTLLPNNAIYTADIVKLKNLINEIYKYTLKDDHSFHFFYEPEIIIRIMSPECLEKTKMFLTSKNIEFEEYDYPYPPEGKFGEDKNGIVAKNLELFLNVFHSNSVAALTMSEEDHFQYLERLMHTAFNPKFFPHEQEGKWLAELSLLKLGKDGLINFINSK